MVDDAVAYVAILQAGEVLPSHAVALLSEWAATGPASRALCGRRPARRGVRRRPHFKPQPNRALMLSGTLTRGVWLGTP